MSTPNHLPWLSHEWNRLMDECKAPLGEARLWLFGQIVTAYSEPHRYYHNLDHIHAMFYDLMVNVTWGLPFCEEFASIELAIWFHDVVYDSHSSDNESRSAEVATRSLQTLALNDKLIRRVCELILMTKDHLARCPMWDTLLFLDLDLSILGSAQPQYQRYADAIRKEYAWVPERDYCLARQRLLQRFLQQAPIFRSDWFKHLEPNARLNLHTEIAQLDETLRTLPS